MIDVLGEQVSVISLGGTGAFLLLAWIVIRGFIKGDIRTKREVDDIRADRDVRVAESNKWQQAYAKQVEVTRTLADQVNRLLPLAETSAHILTSLPEPAEEKTSDEA